MEQHTREATRLIEAKTVELREIRRDQAQINPKLSIWKKLDERAMRLEQEIARLKVMRAQMGVTMKA